MGVEISGAGGGVSEVAFRSDWGSSRRMESGGRGAGQKQNRRLFFFFSGKKSHKSKAARYDQNKLRENSTWSRV